MHLIKQIDFTEDFQGFTLTELSNDKEFIGNEDYIIEKFIKSEYFTIDCLPEIVKTDKSNSDFYLRQLFDNDKLTIKDFKEFSIENLFDFLDDFSKHDDWGDDRVHFIKLLESFKSLFKSKSAYNKFYLISKDWFDKENDKLRNPESWIYIYYFLIVWIDKIEQKLYVCEWTYN